MQIHETELADVTRYLESKRDLSLQDYEQPFRQMLRYVEKFKPIGRETKMLEIGTGTGWFPILCRMKGLSCRGLEISPQLIAYALEQGAKVGVEPDLELGNLEETDLGTATYDVIFCSSVFEHIEHWRKGLEHVYRALKPGGVLFFESTNKFSLTSGEFNFPLYGWLPDAWRYRLRIARQGPDIMKLGIDFNQFTYFRLRKVFRELGFSQIHDRVQVVAPDWVLSPVRRNVLRACKHFSPLRHLVLFFFEGTTFVCIK
jgi:SAM-dependent methyltransferase